MIDKETWDKWTDEAFADLVKRPRYRHHKRAGEIGDDSVASYIAVDIADRLYEKLKEVQSDTTTR